MKKDIETILENQGQIDKKHKLNTCPNQIIKDEILNELETSGATLERLDELSKKIDIFRYRGQITIHGIFSELLNNRIGSYKNIFQNQNKSIGVKWDAIDYEKKSNIYSKLNYFGFSTIHNSKDFAVVRTFRVSTKDEYNEKLTELKAIEQRIDKSLFFGYSGIYTYKIFGFVYLQLVVSINAIYEKNVNTLLSQIAGVPFEQIEQIIDDRIKQHEIERIESQKRWEQEEAEEKAIIDAFIKNNPILGCENVTKYELKEGDILIKADVNSKNIPFYIYKKVVKVKRSFYLQRIKIETGEKDVYSNGSKIVENMKYTGLIIKNNVTTQKVEKVPETKENAPKKENKIEYISGIELIDYSEKAVAVIGETKKYKDTLKAMGGRFNFNLNCGAGWIFPKTKMSELKTKLQLN